MPTDRHNPRSAISLAVAQVLCAGAGLGASVPAFAQAAQPTELNPVIVSATRRDENILDVPYNVSSVSGDDIALRQMLDQSELLRSVSGVGVVDRGPRNSGVFNGIRIRGLNVDSAALGDYAVSSVATVSTYVDDTPIFANFLLKDIARVEVLRGPQGTLYGSGSLGGTVRYVLNQPELGNFSANVGGTLSQVDGSDGTGVAGDLIMNLPVGDTFAVRVNASVADYPGITDYVNLYVLDDNGIPVAPNGVLDPAAAYTSKKDADDVETLYGRLAARWQPSDTFEATLTVMAQDDEYGGRRQPTLGADGFGNDYGRYQNGSIQLEPATRDVEMYALEMNIDLGFATLTSSTSYYDHYGDSTSENTGFYAQLGFLYYYYYNYPRPMASALRTYSDRATIQELRLVSNTGGKFDWVAGLWYQDEDLYSTQDSFLRGYKIWWDTLTGFPAAVTSDQDFIYRRRESFEDRAIYGELTYHASERVHVTGGVRYFDNKSRNDTFMDLPLYTVFSQPTNATFKSDQDDFLFKGNLAIDFMDDDLFYLTYSEGYRRGGSNAVPLTGRYAEDQRWQLYTADTVTNYEAGVKGTVGGMRYDASVFRMDWDDPQFNTATSVWSFFAVQNGSQARSSGVEVQVSGNATDRLTLGGSWAWVKAELTKDFLSPIDDPPFNPIEEDGAQLPGAPDHALTAFMQYRVPAFSGMEFIAHVDGYYQSETRNTLGTSVFFNEDLRAFQIWNAAFTLAAQKWSGSLWIKNIGNEEGVTGVFKEEYMGTAPSQGYFGNGSKELISLPRTLGLSFNYRF